MKIVRNVIKIEELVEDVDSPFYYKEDKSFLDSYTDLTYYKVTEQEIISVRKREESGATIYSIERKTGSNEVSGMCLRDRTCTSINQSDFDSEMKKAIDFIIT